MLILILNTIIFCIVLGLVFFYYNEAKECLATWTLGYTWLILACIILIDMLLVFSRSVS